MSHRTPPWKEEEIARLLSEGKLTYRRIAKRVGVWHGIVSQIAHGTRPDYHAITRPAAKRAAKPIWCPVCRKTVKPPCVACAARAAIAGGERRCWGPEPTDAEAEEFLTLHLSDDEAERTREFRERKQARGGRRQWIEPEEFPDDDEWGEPEL